MRRVGELRAANQAALKQTPQMEEEVQAIERLLNDPAKADVAASDLVRVAQTVEGGAGSAAKIAGTAESTLANEFRALLKSGAQGRSISVEGVNFHDVRVSMRGKELVVRRFGIERVGGVSGHGKVMHSAYEQAALQVGREAGATSVRVLMETVVNEEWRDYLTKSLGYSMQVYDKEASWGIENLLTKVFTL
jgi:hypothetical protein